MVSLARSKLGQLNQLDYYFTQLGQLGASNSSWWSVWVSGSWTGSGPVMGRLASQVVHGPEGSWARPWAKPQGLVKLVGPQIDPIGGGYRRWGGNGSGCNHSAKSCSPINLCMFAHQVVHVRPREWTTLTPINIGLSVLISIISFQSKNSEKYRERERKKER